MFALRNRSIGGGLGGSRLFTGQDPLSQTKSRPSILGTRGKVEVKMTTARHHFQLVTMCLVVMKVMEEGYVDGSLFLKEKRLCLDSFSTIGCPSCGSGQIDWL